MHVLVAIASRVLFWVLSLLFGWVFREIAREGRAYFWRKQIEAARLADERSASPAKETMST